MKVSMRQLKALIKECVVAAITEAQLGSMLNDAGRDKVLEFERLLKDSKVFEVKNNSGNIAGFLEKLLSTNMKDDWLAGRLEKELFRESEEARTEIMKIFNDMMSDMKDKPIPSVKRPDTQDYYKSIPQPPIGRRRSASPTGYPTGYINGDNHYRG